MSMLRVWLCIALVGCGFENTAPGVGMFPDAPPGAWLDGYGYRKPIAITRSGSAAVAEFPVAVISSSDADLAAHARSDGGDLVVTSGDAMTTLDSELASYDPVTGAFEVWARVPSLPTGMTMLYLYYGGPASATNELAVWPSTTFKGVWHLSESTGARDSTGGDHDLANVSAPGRMVGKAGHARSYDGVDDGLEIVDPVDGSLDVGVQSFSYSIWIKSTDMVGEFDNPFFRGGTSNGNPGFCIMTGTSVDGWFAKLTDGVALAEAQFSASPRVDEWLHLVAVVDRGGPALRTYLNGALVTNRVLTLGSLDTPRELRLGFGSGGAQFYGLTDEARIYNVALDAEWIATEYANLATPGFIAIGPEEREP